MAKLVVLKLDGDFDQGFWVTLAISSEGEYPEIDITGHLPPIAELVTNYGNWQSTYHRLDSSKRVITAKKITFDGDIQQRLKDCRNSAQELSSCLNQWLKSETFQPIREQWLTAVDISEQVRVIVRTPHQQLRQLPWHLWDFLERYPNLEVALGAPEYKLPPSQKHKSDNKVRILAILGDSEGLDINEDRKLLEKLPNAAITFLVKPQRQKLSERLRQQSWDILFFAGHSKKEGKMGRIYLNSYDSFTLDELKFALKKAVDKGLQLAIFNSCDGLGLAQELEQLHIPQLIIMRQPVADLVAQKFLQYFLQEFASGKSLYLSVREAREKLQGLEDNFPCASWLPVICQNPAVVPPTWQDLQGRSETHQWQVPLVISIAVAILFIVMRSLGFFQMGELKAFDQLMRLRPQEGQDDRLLVVEATEEDVNHYGFPLPDEILAQTIAKLEQAQPRTLALDIYRDRPVGKGHQQLLNHWQQKEHLIALCKIGQADSPNNPGIKAPPGVPEERLGFSEVVEDPDGVMRRQIVFMHSDYKKACDTRFSLAISLVLHYLQAEGIEPKNLSLDEVKLGKTVLKRLQPNTGAYHRLDNRGFQLLINYRAAPQVARRVTVAEVLAGKVNPDWVKDRAVLLGVTAPISNATDYFLTPYSAGKWPRQEVPGVILHAEMASQLLSAALDKRVMLWVLPKWGEALWIWSWAMLGGVLTWYGQRKFSSWLLTAIALVILGFSCWALLIFGGWLPLIPTALALFITGRAVIVYSLIDR